MSQDRQFLETLFQPTFRVGGMVMCQMQVGHWLLLARLGKLLAPPDPLGAGDLALAMYVCSRPWQKAARSMAKGGWLFRVRIAFLIRSGGRRARALAQWGDYVKWNTEKPVFRSVSGESAKGLAVLNAPFWLTYLRRSKANGMTEEQAFGQRVKTVLWESVADQEDSGAVVWCSDEEMAIQEFVKAQQTAASASPKVEGDAEEVSDQVPSDFPVAEDANA
jgi:hypothetical protein